MASNVRLARVMYRSLLFAAKRMDSRAPWLVPMVAQELPRGVARAALQASSATALVRDAFRAMDAEPADSARASAALDLALHCHRIVCERLNDHTMDLEAELVDIAVGANGDPRKAAEEAALLVARIYDADADIGAARDHLEVLAEAARRRCAEGTEDPRALLSGVVSVFFDECGFHGVETPEEDVPSTASLAEVLHRRLGRSEALSMLLVSVASRLGLHASPVITPEQFLVRVELVDGPVFVDTLSRGAVVTMDDVTERLVQQRVAPGLIRHLLSPAPPRIVLHRMMRAMLETAQDERTARRYQTILSRMNAVLDDAAEVIPVPVTMGARIHTQNLPGLALDSLARRDSLSIWSHRA